MESESVHVHLPAGGLDELILREGKTREPWYANLDGLTIEAIPSYIDGRDLDPKACYVCIDEQNGEVVLACHEGTPNRATLKGALQKHPDVVNLGINSTTMYSSDELMRFLRSRKRLFAKPEDFDVVMKSLTSFKARIVTLTERTDDRDKGKQSATAARFVDDEQIVNAPFRKFSVSLPLFRGSENTVIPIEVGLMPSGNGLQMYLECLDLDSLFESEQKKRLDVVRTDVKKVGIPVLEK